MTTKHDDGPKPPDHKLPLIEQDDEVFVHDGDDAIGAVRKVAPHDRAELVIYVENSGDFTVPLTAVNSVHNHKVVLDRAKLAPELKKAIAQAHSSEEPGA